MPWQLAAVLLTRPRTGLAIMRMMFGGMLPAIRLLKRGRLEESVEHFARRVALGDAAYEAMSPEVRRHMALNAATHKAQFLGKGFPRFSPDDARSIQQPTLVMTGSESPEALRLLAARLRELLPAAEHVEIAGASHVMHQAQPAATADAILAFLRRHSG
jgi:pimeloyl-ACP methyl ester carboxylesterase